MQWKLVAAALCAASWCASANAQETIHTTFVANFLVDRNLTFDSNQASWLPSCTGQTSCTYSDSYPWNLHGALDLTSTDGVHFSGSFPDPYSGLVSLEGIVYPYFETGGMTVDLTRTGPATVADINVQYSRTITSDHFGGSASLASLLSFSIVVLPEPSTWAMMLLGFGGIGLVIRGRRRPVLAKLA